MRQAERADAAQQALTVLATGLHRKMRACDGEVCLELLILMTDGERSVGALARMMSLDLPAVSARLASLKRNGLVIDRREASRKFYALTSLVKVATAGAFRVVTIRSVGGGEVRIAAPAKLMKQIAAKWKGAEAYAAANPEALLEEPRAEVCEVDVSELAARVERANARTAGEPVEAGKGKTAGKGRKGK